MESIGVFRNEINFKNSSSYHYSYIFSFEKSFNPVKVHQWMENNWTKSVYISMAYVIIIFALKKYMTQREPFNVRTYLVIWNTILAVFSVMGALRTLPEFAYYLKEFGLRNTVCDSSFYYSHPITAFWAYVFSMSKVPELLDTVFIVLRKQKLTVLHWSHHAITVVATWLVYSEQAAIARWFFVMNYSVHSIMYSYFALRALNYKLSRKLALFITTSQIIQMFIGFWISTYAAYLYVAGQECAGIAKASVIVGQAVYIFYFFLFLNFFLKSYIVPSKKVKGLKVN